MNVPSHSLRRVAGVVLALLCCAPVLAADLSSPAGRWRTVDDETKEVKSLVEITESNGVLEGVVLQVLKSENGDLNPRCTRCTGERKDQPVVGMKILWDAKRDGDAWSGGQILDPKNGKIYKVTLKLLDGGNKLDVHGYIGFSLLGRSQEWVREDGQVIR